MSSIRIFRSIEEVDQHEWDSLARDQVPMCYGWLKTVEQSYSGNLLPHYQILYENDRPVATSVYRLLKSTCAFSDIDHFIFGRLKPLVSFFGYSTLPVLTSMPLKGYANLFLVDSLAESVRVKKNLQMLLDAIHDHSRRERIAIVFTKVMAEDRHAAQLLRKNGYEKILAAPLAYMDIVWPTFSDYKKDTFRLARNIRRKINWEINRNRKDGIEIVVLENLRGYEDRLYQLLKLNAAKHYRAGLPFNKNLFRSLNENMPNQFRIYAAFKNNQIVGMTLFLTKGNLWHALMVGIDHHLVGKDLTYFNISYYKPIEDAIAAECKRIYYGNSLYEPKMRRGCQLQSVDAYYKPQGVLSRMLFKPYFFVHRARNRRKRPAIVRRSLNTKET